MYTHTHWLNVKEGKKGTVDALNTMKNSYKNCPAYILPHWNDFKNKVAKYLDAERKNTLYRVRKSWDNAKSQIGAYYSLEHAKAVCKLGYQVYDDSGNMVYRNGFTKGSVIKLQNTKLYVSSTANNGITKTGTYYVYDGEVVNNRLRLTTKAEYCGATSMAKYVSGWVDISEI